MIRKYGLKISAAIIVIFLWACVIVLGRSRYDFDDTFQNVAGVATITGKGTGVLTDYDLCIGDTTTPAYGMVQIGNACFGRTSYNVGNVNLDGSVIFRNLGTPATGKIEFLWEEGNGSTRFAIPSSGVGNATYNPRSMLIAGPAPADTNMVTVGYWQGQGIFDNLVCDTSGSGADLGVQNDLEVEGDVFTDNIKESTSGAGVAIPNLRIAGLPVHADNAAAVSGGLSAGTLYRTGGDPDLICVVH